MKHPLSETAPAARHSIEVRPTEPIQSDNAPNPGTLASPEPEPVEVPIPEPEAQAAQPDTETEIEPDTKAVDVAEAPAQAPGPEKLFTEAELAAAEERGYRRGLLEQGEKLMARPTMYERIEAPATPGARNTDILTTLRPSVWE